MLFFFSSRNTLFSLSELNPIFYRYRKKVGNEITAVHFDKVLEKIRGILKLGRKSKIGISLVEPKIGEDQAQFRDTVG